MERYIRTQSSPPSSPVSSARPGPGAAPQYQGEVRHQHPRQPQQPHSPLGGEMRNGASTSSLERVISPAKVKTEASDLQSPHSPLFSLDGRPPVQRLHQFSADERREPPARLSHGGLRSASPPRQSEAGGDSHRPTPSDRSVPTRNYH